MSYTIILREVGGRIHWTLDVVPHCNEVGQYDGAKTVTVVDCITFAGDEGTIGEPDSQSQAQSQGHWLYREYRDEIDCLTKAAIERSREFAA